MLGRLATIKSTGQRLGKDQGDLPRAMDDHNNKMGRKAGKNCKRSCLDSCKAMIEAGELRMIEDDELVPVERWW